MKKIISLLFLFVFLDLQAQINPFDIRESQRTPGQSVNRIKQIIQRADAYWNTHNRFTPHAGLKPYETWKYFWQPYANGNGNPLQGYLQAYRQRRQNPQTDDSDWYQLGDSHYTFTTDGADKGRVNCALIDPADSNIIYIGAPGGGLWKTVDGGQTWTPMSDFLPTIGVSAIALDPNDHNTVYIGTGDDDAFTSVCSGLYVSHNGGQTWQSVYAGFENGLDFISSILINPNNTQIILIGTDNGVYRTTDGGASWNRVLSANPIRDMRFHPTDPSYVYAVTNSEFYRSTDGGATFQQITAGLPSGVRRYAIDVTPAAPNKVYLSAAGQSSYKGFFISTDSGASFSQVNYDDLQDSQQSWYDYAIAVSDTNPDIIFKGELNVMKSVDGGNNFLTINDWSVNNNRFTHADIHYMKYYNGTLIVGSDGGVYISTNDGQTFTSLSQGLAISQLYRISVSEDVTAPYMYGGLQDNGGIAGHNNSWNIFYSADGMDNAIDRQNPLTAYSFIYYGIYMYKTTDGGQSVAGQISGPSYGNWVTPLQMSPNNELYGGWRKLYKLVNNSWTAVTNNSFSGNIDVFEFNPNNAAIIYVGEGNTLYKSMNGGVSFTSLYTFLDDITGIAIDPENNRIWVSTTAGVYQSTDEVNWTDISAGLPSLTVRDILYHRFSPDTRLYVATDVGVYRKIGNASWEVFNHNLPNVPVYDLELSNEAGTLTAATFGRSVWQTTVPSYSPDWDLKVSSNSPDQTIICQPVSQVDFIITNNGTNTVNSFDYTWTANGQSHSDTWTGTLNPGQSTVITANISPAVVLGNVDAQIQTTLTNDRIPGNNDFHYTIAVNKNENAGFSYTFEDSSNDMLGMTSGGNPTQWERGVPSGSNLHSAVSGTKVYGTNLSGNYRNNETDYLYLPCLDFTGVSNAQIGFDMAFNIEQDWDGLYVEYSTDGSNWQILGSDTDPNWYNSHSSQGILRGNQWTGDSFNYRHYSHDLSMLDGEPHIFIRFVLISDQSVNYEGAVIDNLNVSGQVDVDKQQLPSNWLTIYPNPASDRLIIETANQIRNAKINIYNLIGNLLQTLRQTGKHTILDTHLLKPGVYTIKITDKHGTLIKSFLKK